MINKLEILIVEDSHTQAEKLRSFIEGQGAAVSVAYNGNDAISSLKKCIPQIIISDIIMPGMDGYELCRRIKADEEIKDIPVILLTTLGDPENVIRGLQCGADYFITKPYNEGIILSRIKNILENHSMRKKVTEDNDIEIFFAGKKYILQCDTQQICNFLFSTYEDAVQKNRELVKTSDEFKALNEKLEMIVEDRTISLRAEIEERKRTERALKISFGKLRKTLEETVNALASMAEKRDPYTAGHQQRVARLACAIASEMGLSGEQLEGIRNAGILHDIGKICVPSEILNKPGQITEIEMSLIKAHPQVGYEIVKTIPFGWPVADIIIQHHERINGVGYPGGLLSEKILLEAKILGVADVVEAMASHRPYRPALGIELALGEIRKNSGELYDHKVVDATLRLFNERGFTF